MAGKLIKLFRQVNRKSKPINYFIKPEKFTSFQIIRGIEAQGKSKIE